MGVSTDGQICYGIVFEEGHEFPWASDEYEKDISAYFDKMHKWDDEIYGMEIIIAESGPHFGV